MSNKPVTNKPNLLFNEADNIIEEETKSEVTPQVIQDVVDSDKPHLSILYQDKYLVAVHKPAGLFVHRSYLDRHEKYFALQLVRDLVGQYVYPVHRLDRPTSGVLLFALTEEVARAMGEIFSQHKITKTYYALTRGHLNNDGIVDYPLKEKFDKIGDKYANKNKAAQSAITYFQSVATASLSYQVGRYDSVRYSLVKLQPQTGRRHQIRRHLAHLRHPIIGDVNYGDNKQNPFFGELFNEKRLMLIAKSLMFIHPVTAERVEIETEFEDIWQQVFDKCGWQLTFEK